VVISSFPLNISSYFNKIHVHYKTLKITEPLNRE
jgi:hypothetical protein